MQHAYAEINGIRMHYVTHGTGEPILFLHGFPEYWGVWKPLLKEFSKDYRVIAPDLRGYNLTSRPRDVEQYRIQHLVADVRALAEHLGLRKFTLVAQDWGAFLGWSFAIRHPEYIRRFVSIDVTHPAIFDRELKENPYQQKASQYMLGILNNPHAAEELVANDFALPRKLLFEDAIHHGARLSEEDLAEWLTAWRQPGVFKAGHQYYQAARIGPPDGNGFPGGSNLLEDVPQEKWKVNFPVLMLWAEKDPYLLEDCLRGLEVLAPNLTLHKVPGASHWLTLEKPQEVIQHLRDFFAKKG
ncbi:alpha/beta fold hydrolase [Hyalangium rubrum]|uniref:Alpha/beta hydrolase n=1 Tax=Hyalangium rubrum TaxID=3103134 RepID=A0ABU5HI63_9BACT|nr:alpha/beta hydrolase [Hyalangium sp. s54d21]MDY7232936.1 alpha/beta hydrolase [Hyalangium sp. s54d21]